MNKQKAKGKKQQYILSFFFFQSFAAHRLIKKTKKLSAYKIKAPIESDLGHGQLSSHPQR